MCLISVIVMFVLKDSDYLAYLQILVDPLILNESDGNVQNCQRVVTVGGLFLREESGEDGVPVGVVVVEKDLSGLAIDQKDGWDDLDGVILIDPA